MPNTAPAISVVNLTKTLGGLTVLDKLSFDIAQGYTVALVGANGAGKTTLLRCLAALLRPTSGEVRWFGRAAAANPAARRSIGMAAHDSRLYPHLTLKENLLFAARMSDVRDPMVRADELLQDAMLASHADKMPSQISRGMRQRLALARSNVHEPPILLLDEPFASLDRDGANWLFRHLEKLREEKRTVCFVSHDDHTVRRLADWVLSLQTGRIAPQAIASHAA